MTSTPGPARDGVRSPRRSAPRLAGALVDLGAVVAAVAAGLPLAVARALGVDLRPSVLGLAVTGSLGVYLLDRLHDRHADRIVHARRARRFHRHRRAIGGAAAALVSVAVLLGLRQPPAVIALLAAVVVLAAAHRALKDRAWVKPIYVAGSWLAVTVGISLLEAGRSTPAAARASVLGVVGLSLVANVLACDAGDREAEARRGGPRSIWWLARISALVALALSLATDGAAHTLWPVPAAVLVSLLPYRPDPDWTASAVDAALAVGALTSLLL